MSDNTNITQPQDGKKINISQDWELESWSKKFKCTKEALMAAVKKVGPMSSDVEKCLKGGH